MSYVLSVRIDDKTTEMLNALEAKAKEQSESDGVSAETRAQIVSRCIHEYYAKTIDMDLENAYTELMTSSLRAVLSPYFNAQAEAIKRLLDVSSRLDQDVARNDLMNRMSFNLIFRSGELTEDPAKIRKILTKHTPFDDVLKQVADENTYNKNKG